MIYFLTHNMQLEDLNQQELNAQLDAKGIDLKKVPIDIVNKHLKDVENKIDDPKELMNDIVHFIDSIRDDDTYA